VTLACNASLPSWPTVTATDNCDGDVQVTTGELLVYESECEVVYERQWHAYDDCGNLDCCSQIITIPTDIVDPVITITGVEDGECYATEPNYTIGASDNCDGDLTGAVVTDTWTVGCWTYIEVYVYDACGNRADKHLSFKVDGEDPVLEGCPADVTLVTLACNASLPPWPTVTATDNCDDVEVTRQQLLVHESECMVVYERQWHAYDDCGNWDWCSQIITIPTDLVDPEITSCPTGGDLGCNPASIPGADPDGVDAWDNCGVDRVEWRMSEEPVGICGMQRTYIYTVYDTCENTDTCEQVWTWTVDTEDPEITSCPPGGDLGCNPASIPEADPDSVGARDNCGVDRVEWRMSEEPVGVCGMSRTYTYTVYDICGVRQAEILGATRPRYRGPIQTAWLRRTTAGLTRSW